MGVVHCGMIVSGIMVQVYGLLVLILTSSVCRIDGGLSFLTGLAL
jgi:hypothetical protein